MSRSRAHAHTCEDLDPDLADAVSTMLLAVAADLKAAAAGCHFLVMTRHHLIDAHEQLLEAALSLAEASSCASPSVEAYSANKFDEHFDSKGF